MPGPGGFPYHQGSYPALGTSSPENAMDMVVKAEREVGGEESQWERRFLSYPCRNDYIITLKMVLECVHLISHKF